MIKRKAAYALVGGLLVAGLVFNAPSMATYVQNLGTATQTINAATWNVEFGSNLGTHTILPGDVISNDTITLKNNNNYAVKYTINLEETGNGLEEKLTLDLLKGEDSTGIKSSNNSIGFLVRGGETVVLTSKVSWENEEDAYEYQGQSVTYKYDIKAEKVNDIIEETPQQGVQVITVSSKEAIEKVLEDITKEDSDAVIEDIKETEDYYEYTIRVQKKSATFDYNTDKYDYIVVKVPKALDDGTISENIERTIFKITSAYRASKDQKLHVHFKLNESVNLDNSNDNVKILYLNENGSSVNLGLTDKDKISCGYLNKSGVKYGKGVHLGDSCEYSNDLQPGVYSTTAKANANVKAIKVIIIKDGVEYAETWNL